CHGVAVHEFAVDETRSCIYAHCDPEGPVPETTIDVVSFLWSNGPAEALGPMLQRPDAARVAGYRSWQRLGHQVNKGAKGIAILAPCVYRKGPVDEVEEADK